MQEKYWASKVPLPLALLFLVNVFLIIGAELLFVYKYPAKPDSADLARYDSLYEGCSLVNQDTHYNITASLVKTVDEQTHLVVAKTHSLAYGRGRIIYAQPVEMDDSGEVTVNVKTGVRSCEIAIREVPTDLLSVTIVYNGSGNVREITTWYMLLAAALEALELMILHFIKNRLQ